MPNSLRFSIIFILVLSILTAQATTDKKKDKKAVVELPHMPKPDPLLEIHKDRGLKESPVAKLPSQRVINSNIEGIDVSHYQGTIDWETVAKSNKIGYAFVKASESNYFIDDYYAYNLSEGRKHGIAMGSYHFFRANVDVDQQFKHLISVIDPAKQDIVPMIDVEAANGVGVETFARRLKVFMQKVEEYYGRPPILYTYVNFYNKYIAYRGFERYPLMIAFYNDNIPAVADGNKYVIWQYSCRGRINGVSGDVDRSRFMNGFSIEDILF